MRNHCQSSCRPVLRITEPSTHKQLFRALRKVAAIRSHCAERFNDTRQSFNVVSSVRSFAYRVRAKVPQTPIMCARAPFSASSSRVLFSGVVVVMRPYCVRLSLIGTRVTRMQIQNTHTPCTRLWADTHTHTRSNRLTHTM